MKKTEDYRPGWLYRWIKDQEKLSQRGTKAGQIGGAKWREIRIKDRKKKRGVVTSSTAFPRRKIGEKG